MGPDPVVAIVGGGMSGLVCGQVRRAAHLNHPLHSCLLFAAELTPRRSPPMCKALQQHRREQLADALPPSGARAPRRARRGV